MSTILRVHRMLGARRKRWLAPVFLVTVMLGRLAMPSRPVERDAFIYTLF